jgi:hypothetical protein
MIGRNLTRRQLFGWFAAAAAASIVRKPIFAAPAKLAWADSRPGATAERRYRADAQVLFMSMTVFHRSGVGGGSAVWNEWKDATGASMRHLEFSGYSLPDRAAGLDRVGLIRELARSHDTAAREAIYFGIMSASNETTSAEAREALASKRTEAQYSAIEGHIAPASVSSVSAQFVGPAQVNAAHRAELVELAHQALAKGERKEAAFPTAPPFLNALADALGRQKSESRFIYSGRSYRLSVKQAVDPKAGEYFRQRKLIAPGIKVMRAEGKTRPEAGGKETEFHVWVAQGDARKLPLRIEYQPKSFLRLTFEAEA